MSGIVKEKPIRRRTIYQGKIVDLFVDQVEIPDGSLHIREVVGHQPAVAVVPVLDDGQLLLIRQYRYAVKSTCWEIPAGLIHSGETPYQAAKRECWEETGYRPKKLVSLGWIYSSPGFSQERIHLYLATQLHWMGALNLDRDEFLEVHPVNLQQVARLKEKGQIKDGKTLLALLLANRRLDILS